MGITSNLHNEDKDNALEDYFFKLITGKPTTAREIMDIYYFFEKTKIADEDKTFILRFLFGEDADFIHDETTLIENLREKTQDMEIFRKLKREQRGIIIHILFRITEEVFDIADEHMLKFLMNEQKEDVELGFIYLVKAMMDSVETEAKVIFERHRWYLYNASNGDEDSPILKAFYKEWIEYIPRLFEKHDRDITDVRAKADTIGAIIIEQNKKFVY